MHAASPFQALAPRVGPPRCAGHRPALPFEAEGPFGTAPKAWTIAPHRAPRDNRQIGEMLALVQEAVNPPRRTVHAGDVIYRSGDPFDALHVANSGFLKVVNVAIDGRERVAGLKFRGDWLGFDGIAAGRYASHAIALDTGEIWRLPYASLIAACSSRPALMTLLHEAMSAELAQERDSLMSLCMLPADARVAEFLRNWTESLARRGLRTDQITLPLSRAEIGNYLGVTIETVSRALARLAREGLIAFAERRRRELQIPDTQALVAFVQRAWGPAIAASSDDRLAGQRASGHEGAAREGV